MLAQAEQNGLRPCCLCKCDKNVIYSVEGSKKTNSHFFALFLERCEKKKRATEKWTRGIWGQALFLSVRELNECKNLDTYLARFDKNTGIEIDIGGDKFRHVRQTIQYLMTENSIFLYCCPKSVFVLEELSDR